MDNDGAPSRTLDAAREGEELFRLLVSSVKEYAIFMLDTRGYVSSWNPGAERLKGYRADEIIGQHFSRFYPPEISREVIDNELVIALREGQFRDEGWRLKQDGSTFWADVTITPVRRGNGVLIGFAKVTRDLTARRLSEQDRISLIQSQAARDAAERSNRVKDEFLATLSHELRTPLNAITGWASILANHPDPNVVRGVEVIGRNALMQGQLIGDILDIQRLATGKLRLSIQETNVAATIEAALDTLRPAAQKKNITLAPILDTTLGPLSADPERLQQIVWNLLANAIKFTPNGGRVSVRLRRYNSQVEISVEDTGPGISLDFLPYVFERFRQSDSSTTRKHGGLGLGLSIVRSLAELHGGTVTAMNRHEGNGAVFTVRLPITSITRRDHLAGESTDSDSTVALRTAPSLDGLAVLVIDDQVDALEIVASVLEQRGANVLQAASATEGFSILQRTRPDIIVCDIGMPDQDGYAFIERVRTLPANEGGLVPAIALTAFATTADRMRALTAGFQTHVPKPVQPAELVTVIASLCGRTRLRQP